MEFVFSLCIHGYHAAGNMGRMECDFKRRAICECKIGNIVKWYVVTVQKDPCETVGYMLRKISKICSSFLQQGRTITAKKPQIFFWLNTGRVIYKFHVNFDFVVMTSTSSSWKSAEVEKMLKEFNEKYIVVYLFTHKQILFPRVYSHLKYTTHSKSCGKNNDVQKDLILWRWQFARLNSTQISHYTVLSNH